MLETTKEELLNSLKNFEDKDEEVLDETVAQAKNPKEAAGVIRRYIL